MILCADQYVTIKPGAEKLSICWKQDNLMENRVSIDYA